RGRQLDIQRLSGPTVDCQLKLYWRLDGQLGRLSTLQDAVDISRGSVEKCRTTPIAETARRSRMLSRALWRYRRLRAATRPASLARPARNPRLGLAIHHSG